MQKAHLTLILAIVAAASSGAQDSLPKRVSDDVKNIVRKAENAVADSDYQLALALYEGALYSGGITFAVDSSSVDYFEQEDVVRRGLKVWSDELVGDFPVRFASDPTKADVVLSFVDSLKAQGPDALGLISLRKNYRWNSSIHEVSYKGTIQVVRSAPGGALTKAETLDVILHEFGHLLGLGDVSKVGVLMGPLKRGNPLYRPTEDEIQDVRNLRAMLRNRISQVQTMAKKARNSHGSLSYESSHAVRIGQ